MVYQPSPRARTHQWVDLPGARREFRDDMMEATRRALVLALRGRAPVVIILDVEIRRFTVDGDSEEVSRVVETISLLNRFAASGFRYWQNAAPDSIWSILKDDSMTSPEQKSALRAVRLSFHVNYALGFVSSRLGGIPVNTTEGFRRGASDAQWWDTARSVRELI